MKKIIVIILLLGMLMPTVLADTGTYEVDKEYVDLVITQNNTNVKIKYQITMSVTSGNIPWVTVGLPNSKYTIKDYGGAAKNCKRDNYGSWTGVKITLDKTYYSGDSFSFWFEVTQKGFIYYYEKENKSSIQFTPCWWDNAITEDLKVVFQLPPQIREVVTTAQGAKFGESTVTWQWLDVPKGTKHKVGMLMPLEAFSSLGKAKDSNIDTFIILIVVIFCIMMFGAFAFLISNSSSSSRSSSRKPYTSPRISASGTEKKIRHINLKCPKDETALSKRTVKSTTLDFCETCGGVYLDKGEIEELIESDVNEKDFNTSNIETFKVQPGMKLKCPRCEGKFKRHVRTLKGQKYSIYHCEDCKGLWINHGQYQPIKDKRKEQIEIVKAKIEKAGGKDKMKREDYYDDNWWFFYPILFVHRPYIRPSPPARVHKSSSSSYSSCACVSCACVASCACACACAGGGAAGCAPKNKISQINFKPKKIY